MKYLLLAVAVWSGIGICQASAQGRPGLEDQRGTQGTAAPARPLPEGARIAFIVPQRIVAESALGKASAARVAELRSQKLGELAAKNKDLEALQQKLVGGNLLSDDARLAAQRSADRIQIELQRMQQDADAAVQDLQQQLNIDLERVITPLLEQVAVDKGVLILLRADTGAVAWADPGLDVTGEIIRRMDASRKTAAGGPR